jgi:hypothetical protein
MVRVIVLVHSTAMSRNQGIAVRPRTLVNPRPQAVRLVLSDGGERIIGPWGLTVLPEVAEDGLPLTVIQVCLLERRTIPGGPQH